MASNKTCSSCIYWDASHRYVGPDSYGACVSPKFVYWPDMYSQIAEQVNDLLIFADYEDYQAWVSTGPDFGCIHHKKAEDDG